MTTFTTEDRIHAEKDGSFTVTLEPIPFAGMVTINEPQSSQDQQLEDGDGEGIK